MIGSAPDPSSKAPLVPGLSLGSGDLLAGRFRLEAVLSADRAFSLISAVQTTTRKRVVVEIILAPKYASERAIDAATRDAVDDARLRFLAGARRARMLEGSRLARVLDAGVTPDGHPYVVREHVEQRTLASILAEKASIATPDAVDVAVELCEALAAAHARGLVHGEISTDCVRLAWSADGVEGPSDVKIVGVATAYARSRLALAMGEVESFENGAQRAPELLQAGARAGVDVDPAVDVWGIGVVLYTMLAGAAPFAAETASGVNLAIALDEPPGLAGVPDALAEIVEQCLAKTPALRPASVSQLAKRLAPFGARAKERLERLEALGGPPGESMPTLVVAEKSYEALKSEKSAPIADADSTAPRHALVAAMAEIEKDRDASSLDIDVEVAPSVRDVSEVDPSANSPTPSSIPPPVVVSTPAPPREAPTVVRPRPANRSAWRATALGVAAACLVVGVVIGAQATRMSLRAEAPSEEPAQPAAATAVPAAEPAGSPASPPAEPESAAAPPAMEASALPAAARPRAAAKPKPQASTPPKAASPSPEAPAARSTPTSETKSNPETKANDDDLRRFLDDRR